MSDLCQIFGGQNQVRLMLELMPELLQIYARNKSDLCQTYVRTEYQTYVRIHVNHMPDLCQQLCQMYANIMSELMSGVCQSYARLMSHTMSNLCLDACQTYVRNHVKPMPEMMSRVCHVYVRI